MKLKKLYTSREVATMTGLTARQLQWWDTRRLFAPAVAPHRTEAGGFTERRYTPFDVMELQVLADLRRRHFSVTQLRHLLTTLREVFGVRLYDAIGEGGPMTLYVDGPRIYARLSDGRLFDLERPAEPLLMIGGDAGMRPLDVRERRGRQARRRVARPGK